MPSRLCAQRSTGSLRRVLCRLSLCLAISSTAAGAALVEFPSSQPASAATSKPLIAAEYFGTASPVNFWVSDLSGARSWFQQMKSDGFNAVGLIIPWGYFEPNVLPPKFNPAAFSRLNRLISVAQSLNLKVVIRLSYEWDMYPPDQMPGEARILAAFAQGKVFQSWLGFIQHVKQDVSPYPNVAAHYISWEDFWVPIQEAQAATTQSQQLQIAQTSGYQTWLQAHYSLNDVSSTYGTSFSSWQNVPAPDFHSQSFQLMYKFDDSTLVNGFFKGAQARWPGLTMETRVESDAIYNGPTVVGSFAHTDMYQIPGVSPTGIYFAPYMSDPSTSTNETASDAIAALRSVLSGMSSNAGGRPLYIYEYEFVTNAPQISGAPNLTPDQVPPFLAQSKPLLQQYTTGYALWTYRDFTLSAVFNPSFSLGTMGWTTSGQTAVVNPPKSINYLSMGPGSSVSQTVNPAGIAVVGSKPVTLNFQAAAPSGSGSLSVSVGGASFGTINLSGGWNSYNIQIPQSKVGNGVVSFTAAGQAKLSNVQLFGFTQLGDVYNTAGQPEVGAAPLRALNHQLTGS